MTPQSTGPQQQSESRPLVQSRQSRVEYQRHLFSASRLGDRHDKKSKLSPLFDWRGMEKRKGKGKKKKIPTWSHMCVCLSSTSHDTIPDSQERAELQIAGLGEKKISLSSNADAHDICFSLCEHYAVVSGRCTTSPCDNFKPVGPQAIQYAKLHP